MNFTIKSSPSAVLSFTNDKLYPVVINVTYTSKGTKGSYGEGKLNTSNLFSKEIPNNILITVEPHNSGVFVFFNQ